MKIEYEMSQTDLDQLHQACKRIPVIALNCGYPTNPQAVANAAWAALGEKMGFQPMTVEPVAGKGDRFFRAEPAEAGGTTA